MNGYILCILIKRYTCNALIQSVYIMHGLVIHILQCVIIGMKLVNKEKPTLNSGEINLSHIVFTVFRLIWNQTEFCFVSNQSENGRYNLIRVALTGK